MAPRPDHGKHTTDTYHGQVFETPVSPWPDGLDLESLRLDYEKTLSYWLQLVDVRFKLLALVPTVTAAGVAIFGRTGSWESAALGVVGFVAVVAIVMYDLRNSLLHDLAVHRMKALERQLGLRRTTWVNNDPDDSDLLIERTSEAGGVFADRFRPDLRLFRVLKVWHDGALRIAYSASAAAWAGLVARGVYDELASARWSTLAPLVFGAAGLGVFVGMIITFRTYDLDWERLRDGGPS